ncbi:uroporphyrinogen decarboxylase family protein, partial [Candidatus Sumerlaeota bacterium]
SLERMMAAVRGESLDRYPVMNPYPFYSLQPYWPELAGLTFIHPYNGSDKERLACYHAAHEQLGIDCLPVWGGPCGQDKFYRIENKAGDCPSTWSAVEFPLYVHDLRTDKRSRVDDYYIDPPVEQRRYNTVADVEAEAPPPTAAELLANGSLELTHKIVRDMGATVFLYCDVGGPFSRCFRSLTFEGLFEALIVDPPLVHAIAERRTSGLIQFARAQADAGIHAIRINEYPCGADLISDEQFTQFVLPYLKQLVDAFHDLGLLVILEFLGWVEPRLKHIAKLEVDILQIESSMKGYRNDVAECRRVLGDGVCILGNSPILVIEKGDENAWRADAEQQSRGIGAGGRFGICTGSPTTRATPPQRLRDWGRFMQDYLTPERTSI